VLRLVHSTNERLDALLDAARRATFSYDPPGATRDPGAAPSGYRLSQSRRTLGASSAFEAAARGVRTWQMHKGAGATVVPEAFGVGETVLVVMGLGPLEIVAPCRIVYVVDEPNRFGFAYGTLPGHPESGEEAFIVETSEGRTTFSVTSLSRPAELLARLAGPAGRLVQSGMTRRYMRAMQAWVSKTA
jgi:uncharacterized protein (UPF0548 family)